MGEVTESRRRHYVGDDADKASIPAGGKSFGDSYHANDKGKQYYWDGTAWKTGLGYEYVPRAVAAVDFGLGDFGVRDAWQADALDFTGIVPAGAVAVHAMVSVRGSAASLTFGFRANATTKTLNKIEVNTQVANVFTSYVDSVVFIDTDRLADYFNKTGIDTINMIVLGWFI